MEHSTGWNTPDIVCLCETHLADLPAIKKGRGLLRRLGYEGVFGRSVGVAGLVGVGGGSGGVCIAWKKGMSISLVDERVWRSVLSI